MHPLETYLTDLAEIHASGAAVKETSGYPALRELLNEVGKSLKPKVRCIVHLKNKGAGIPDAGLFTVDQLRNVEDEAALAGQLPARAVIEAKDPAADLDALAQSNQVAKYLERYGLVLLTNYRAFLLVQKEHGRPAEKLERYEIAPTAGDFWKLARHPRKAADEQGDRLADYLKRGMLIRATLSKPADLAAFLASYAREALARVESAQVTDLDPIRAALEKTLGLSFKEEKADHFFRSTLVQTLFYGVFSAWVLWHEEDPQRTDYFDWRTSAYHLKVPVIQALFEQVGDASTLRALNLVEVLNWAGAALNRVNRAAFFAAFETGHAVQYFYEPFLEAFDPVLRKSLGVWYTPPEIVQYMVARVDTVLREELGIADGLADPSVVVLDPCAGTGAYLVETLKRIAATLQANGEGALTASEVRRAALSRIFGFEILPASYIIAHLQLGLLLQSLGAPLGKGERAAMYLTNSLTGWDPASEHPHLPFLRALEKERDAAEKVKCEQPILVVLGNPPYNAFAGVSPAEEQGLVEPYKEGLVKQWGIKKFNLDDLYIRFFRLAERRIAEHTGRGVVCYISNFSYLGDPSFVVMRRRFLREFDELWFDSLNGDSRETGKLTPEGKPDPSVFSTDFNREGIRVGTVIGLMVRKTERAPAPVVRFRQFWGVTKRTDLLKSLDAPEFDQLYAAATPTESNRYSFRPSDATAEYMSWPKLTDLCAEGPINGLMEKRGGALIDMDRASLEYRMRKYFDKEVKWQDLEQLGTGLTEDAAGFEAKKVRPKIQKAEQFDSLRLRRYALRPFDTRWCYYSPIAPLWNRARQTLWAQLRRPNLFLMSRPAGVADPEGVPFYFTRLLGDNDFLRGHAYYFPVHYHIQTDNLEAGQLSILHGELLPRANVSLAAAGYLAILHLPDPDSDAETAALIWYHALAIGYSPAYLTENADGIRQDWPRVPLPATKELLVQSAALGKQIAALLDTGTPVPGVTTNPRRELREIGVLEGETPLDLEISAGWGSAGKEGVTMPGKGRRVERVPGDAERVPELGETTFDVYLNDTAYWRNVPARVWDYTIGGYQVIKKWLSYREARLLGRPITPDEAREVRDMARRIAAILLLEPELDANYREVKANTYPWPQAES